MTTPHDVFGERSLSGPPTKRAAYSDRTSLLMAEMSKLAYMKFEDPPDTDEARKDELRQIIENIKGAADDGQAQNILASYVTTAPQSARERAKQDLRAKLAEGHFILVNTYVVGDTQAFLAATDPDTIGPDEDGIAVLSFRGTESTEDWKTNLNAFKNIENRVPVHSGFLEAFRLVQSEIRADINNLSRVSIYITGHSLGGALALIATKEIADNSQGACYTFGRPRVAGFGYALSIKTPIYRVVNSRDIAPRIPPVFVLTVLSAIVSVAPIPYQKWIVKFLEKFTGYVHHEDMRYLTRTKNERTNGYHDVRLLANPNMIFRAFWWFKGVWRKPRSPIDDHSIDTYCKKLKVYALTRLNI